MSDSSSQSNIEEIYFHFGDNKPLFTVAKFDDGGKLLEQDSQYLSLLDDHTLCLLSRAILKSMRLNNV